jgi:hypothetical protein
MGRLAFSVDVAVFPLHEHLDASEPAAALDALKAIGDVVTVGDCHEFFPPERLVSQRSKLQQVADRGPGFGPRDTTSNSREVDAPHA